MLNALKATFVAVCVLKQPRVLGAVDPGVLQRVGHRSPQRRRFSAYPRDVLSGNYRGRG